MVQVTMRRHDQIDTPCCDFAPAQVRLEPGKAAEGWAEFLTKAGIDKETLPSRVGHQRVVRGFDHRRHEVAFNTGMSSASEAFIAKIGPIGICNP
jgi:hypothetical protein